MKILLLVEGINLGPFARAALNFLLVSRMNLRKEFFSLDAIKVSPIDAENRMGRRIRDDPPLATSRFREGNGTGHGGPYRWAKPLQPRYGMS